MPIEISQNIHEIPHGTFHKGITYKELFGHSDGDGLTCGTLTIQGDPEIAVDNPYGIVGIVTEGSLVLIDSGTPDDHHELKEGQVFHIPKGSTFKWGASSNGKAFYAVAKPIDRDASQLNLKKPVF